LQPCTCMMFFFVFMEHTGLFLTAGELSIEMTSLLYNRWWCHLFCSALSCPVLHLKNSLYNKLNVNIPNSHYAVTHKFLNFFKGSTSTYVQLWWEQDESQRSQVELEVTLSTVSMCQLSHLCYHTLRSPCWLDHHLQVANISH